MKKQFNKILFLTIIICIIYTNNVLAFYVQNDIYNYEKDYIVSWDFDNYYISNDGEWGYYKSSDGNNLFISQFYGDINSKYICDYDEIITDNNTNRYYSLTVPFNIDGNKVLRLSGLNGLIDFQRNHCPIRKINVENGIKQIGTNQYDTFFGFMDNSNSVKDIVVPNSVDIIFHEISFVPGFQYKPDILTIVSNPDSYARQFADQHNCNWRCINHQNIITTIGVLEPTYDNDGHTEQKECGDCGTIIEQSVIIPKLVKKQNETDNKNKTVNSKSNFVYNFSKYSYSAEIVKIKKQKKKVTIPSTIIANNINYKVTDILKNAFRHNKKIKKIIIGKNIISIGDNAFNGCKNLKNIIIKTNKLNFVGESAFKNIKKNARIFIPAKKYKKYKRFFKNIKNVKRKRKYKVIYLK